MRLFRTTPRPAAVPAAVCRAAVAVIETLEHRQLLSAVPVNYTVPTAGKVSLGVYDGAKLVRTLLSAADRPAGAHTEMWDGLDDHGKALPGKATYTYKLLELTSPLRAEFVTTPGDSYPKDPNNYYGAAPGNHIAAMAVAVDPTGIYIGAGGKESVGLDLKLTPDGNARLWTNATTPETWWTSSNQTWHGVRAIATAGDTAYYLYSNHTIGKRTISENDTAPYTTYSGEAKVGDIDVRWYDADPAVRTNGPSSYEGAVNIDMAVRQVGTTTLLVVSYTDKNQVFFWDAATGARLARTSLVTAPTGVAIDAQGRALVAAGDKVVRLTRSGTSVAAKTVIGAAGTDPSPLKDAYRLDVGPTGHVLVADRGTSQQVKRFDVSSVTADASPAVSTAAGVYGAAGGRQDGLYVKGNFAGVTDLAATADGGFIVAEPYEAPVRVAKFAANGAWEREWTGGSEWVRGATFEPDNPTVMWGETAAGTITRYVIDPATRAWSVHSNFTFDPTFNAAPAFLYWHAVRNNGATYLFRSESPEVLRVKVTGAGTAGERWELLKAAYLDPTSSGATDYNASTGKYNDHATPGSVWSDNGGTNGVGAGNGLRDPGETKYYKTNWGGSNFWASRNDEGGNYYGVDTINRKINMVPAVSWGPNGPNYDLGTEISWNPADTTKANDDYYNNLPSGSPGSRFSEDMVYAGQAYSGNTAQVGQRVNAKDSYPLYRENGSSPLYAALTFGQEGVDGWGSGRVSRVGKWSAAGELLWEAGQAPINDNYYDRYHTVRPGEVWSDFRSIVGPVADPNAGGGESIVVNDYDGGYSGTSKAKTYVWDRDGLFAGGLFDTVDLTNGRTLRDYSTGTEVAATDVVRDPATGAVYYVAGRENHIRMYKITGWDNWHRASGAIPALPAPTLTRTNGLEATYYDSAEFSDAKVVRVDASPNFTATSATAGGSAAPAGSGITSADNYTIQWLGDLTVPTSGTYSFSLRVHGGAQLFVNGQAVFANNGWSDRSTERTLTGSVSLTAGQRNSFRLEFLQNMIRGSSPSPAGTENTALELKWMRPGETAYGAIPTDATTPFSHTDEGDGVGLTARYYDNANFTSLKATRVDATVNLPAGTGVPAGTNLTSADGYSVRWTGRVTVPTAGRYTFAFDGDDGARLWVNGRQVLERWTNGAGKTAAHPVSLAPGKSYDIRLDYFETSGGASAKLLWTRPGGSEEVVPTKFLYPSGDVPQKVSFLQGAGVIQAEDYDEGGQGVAFSDTTPSSGSSYRGYEGVELQANYDPTVTNANPTAVALVNYEVQANKTEWLKYTVNTPQAGTYAVKVWMRSGYSGNTMKILVDGVDRTGAVAIPATNWTGFFLSTPDLQLAAGTHEVRIEFAGTGANPTANVDYLQVTGGPAATNQPFHGAAPIVDGTGPTRVEAEDYDAGGEGVAYHDADGTNTSGSYRTDGVDIGATGDAGGGFAVNNFGPSEWVEYTVTVPTAGFYSVTLRTATTNATGAAKLWVDGTAVAGNIAVPDTDSWTTFADATKAGVYLPAGTYPIRLENVGSWYDVNWLQFAPPAPAELAGTAIGTPGSFDNLGNTVAKAFDGSLSTYFDPPSGTTGNQWAGLDLGTAKTVTQVRFAPRAAWAPRMVGGAFQVSDTADFSTGVTTVYTVPAAPSEGVLTVANVAAAATGRYVRYLAPADQWGNVAELEFWGW